MSNFLKFVGVIILTVVIPLAILLGIWAGFLPDVLQIVIAQTALALSIIYIVGGMLYLMYSDIKTKRYTKK